MSRKLVILMRVLSVVTLLEAAGGLFMAGSALIEMRGPARAILLGEYPAPNWAVYGMPSINIIFIILLLLSAARIWRLDRNGLWLLVCTLCAEVAYFAAVTVVPMLPYFRGDPHRKAASFAFLRLAGFGNLGLGVQVITAYPIFAAVVIFFSYRRLGIPARDRERGAEAP